MNKKNIILVASILAAAGGLVALALFKHQKAHLTAQREIAEIDKQIKELQLKKLKTA